MVGVQFMCNFDAGGNRGAGTIKSAVLVPFGGISIMGRNTIVAQEQLFMPRFRNGGVSESKKNSIRFFFKKKVPLFSMITSEGG